MFVDTVKVQARAGKGGNGCIAFSHEPFKPKGGRAAATAAREAT